MIVVSNATPLIALAKIDELRLLPALFDTILIPEAVYREVVENAPDRPGAVAIRNAEWIDVRAVSDRSKVDYLRADLDPGESEVLILAQETGADWVLLDEPKARLAAGLLALKFVGTVGILLLAKRTGEIEAVRPLLEDLRAQRFYLSDRVYQAVLRRADE